MKNIIRIGAAVGLILSIVLTGNVSAAQGGNRQVVVCKYVGIPGANERLQTGQNPIVVSENALEGKGFDGTFPFEFSDRHGRSIAIRFAANSHDGDISECPGYVQPTPTPDPTPVVTPTPTDTPRDTTGTSRKHLPPTDMVSDVIAYTGVSLTGLAFVGLGALLITIAAVGYELRRIRR